ncbi:5f493928-fe23-43e0-a7f2-ed01054586f1 [Sclerotinia trifoliorum]|uniref:5f493928-fe23-43e0-a7f2-ed01054586f1 n=1 Tax=Sclerotinia trifoliorum TaxID=28548 RepID=A0A8H2VUB5_9HELO|nr:5f493928-fe23-43e0-a7f2-ed01054586f1 [Sclerotinia trifoliorum]
MSTTRNISYVQRNSSFQEHHNKYPRENDCWSSSSKPDFNSQTYNLRTRGLSHCTSPICTSPTDTNSTDISFDIHDDAISTCMEESRNACSSQYHAGVSQSDIATSSDYNDYLWQDTSYQTFTCDSELIYDANIDPSLWNCGAMSTGPTVPRPAATEAQSILDEPDFNRCWDIPSMEGASMPISEHSGGVFPSCMVDEPNIARTPSVNSFRSAVSDYIMERQPASYFFDTTEFMMMRSQSIGEESYRSESTLGSPPPGVMGKSSSCSKRKRRIPDSDDPNHINRRGDTGRRKLDRYFCTRCNAFPKGWKLPEDLRKHNQAYHTETGFYCASGVAENCAYWSSQESRYVDHLKAEHAHLCISQETIRKYNTINGITVDGNYMCRIPGCKKVYKRAERGRRDKHEERKAAHSSS